MLCGIIALSHKSWSFYLKAVGARLGDGVGGDGRCSCGSGLGAVLVMRFVLGVVLSVVVFILLFFLSQRTQKGEYVVKVAFEHYAYALSGQRALQIIVLVVVAVIGLELYCAGSVEQIAYVEVTDEAVVVERLVAIAEVAVE